MNPTQSLVSQPQYDQLSVNYLGSAGQQRFIVLLCLNCLCANLAYGLQELNKTYLLTYRLPSSVSTPARLTTPEPRGGQNSS